MRVLAVDPGEKRLGLAISDPTGTIANPLGILKHVSRIEDAKTIVQIAAQHGVTTIVVGQALDEDGKPSFEGRRAARLARAIRQACELPVELWDESESSQIAQMAQRALGRSRKGRRHLDDLAATVFLQTYLDQRARPGISVPE